jgi:radical SAM/Cys-rich protein
MLGQARLAEALGFETLWAHEHHSQAMMYPDPLMTLAVLAGATERIGLGTNMLLLPIHHPVRVAQEGAMVDVLSHGRLRLGVANGYSRADLRTFGVPRSHRGARLTAGIELIRALWRGDGVTRSGEDCELRVFRLFPLPLQRPTPPIVVGGQAEVAIRRAARLGDGYLISTTEPIDEVARLTACYHRVLGELGRPAQGPLLNRLVCVVQNRSERAEAVRFYAHALLALYDAWGHSNVTGLAPDAREPETLARTHFVIGEPSECVERVEEYEAIGIRHIACLMNFGGPPLERVERSMRLLGERVMPAVAGSPLDSARPGSLRAPPPLPCPSCRASSSAPATRTACSPATATGPERIASGAPPVQLQPLPASAPPDFSARLARAGGARLCRGAVRTLQLNVTKRCDLACHHCHVESGPKRTEAMDRRCAERVLELLARNPGVATLDLTGGAPELSEHFRTLVGGARALGRRVIDRCNLTVLHVPGQEDTAGFLAAHEVHIIASLPCYTRENVERQRGRGVFRRSIDSLRALNGLGYGLAGSPLRLDLVYNPLGPTLPPPQAELAARYREELRALFGIEFHELLTLTNMPIKRFARELERTGRHAEYLSLLANHFNPETISGLMCRELVSVGHDGRLHDCDFNQALEIPLPGSEQTIWDVDDLGALDGRPVATASHCFGCTAGAGSSCGGAITR